MWYPTDGTLAVDPIALTVGQEATIDGRPWTVAAVTANFAALTAPVTEADLAQDPDEEADVDVEDVREVGDPQYTVIDWRNGIRGPCNMSGWGWGDGTYTETECAQMLAEFEAGELEVSHRNWVRVAVGEVR